MLRLILRLSCITIILLILQESNSMEVDVFLKVYLLIGALLFATGVFIIATKRNTIMVLIGIELMLNASMVNLVMITGTRLLATSRRGIRSSCARRSPDAHREPSRSLMERGAPRSTISSSHRCRCRSSENPSTTTGSS